MRRKRTPGFSLLEVLLATSILLACFIVLGQLAQVGRRHAEDVEDLSTAQLICHSKLNEIAAGAVPLTSVEDAAVAGAPGWVYSVDIEYLEQLDLVAVRVTVSGEPGEADNPVQRPKKSFSLTRWVHSDAREGNQAESREWLEPAAAPSDFDQGVLP
jgi:hypothetical protein